MKPGTFFQVSISNYFDDLVNEKCIYMYAKGKSDE